MEQRIFTRDEVLGLPHSVYMWLPNGWEGEFLTRMGYSPDDESSNSLFEKDKGFAFLNCKDGRTNTALVLLTSNPMFELRVLDTSSLDSEVMH